MKSILGIGNALTDILAVLPDDEFLQKYHLPKGSMQHVDMETGDKIWSTLKKEVGVRYVAGGSAANTITCTAIFGMPSGFIGKIGDDELGHLFKSDQEQYGVNTRLLKGKNSSGRSMVFITGANAERTFAVYLGAALELVPEDLKPEYFQGYDYFHIEGYLVQNQELIRTAVKMAKEAGCIISIDMASYNVVESNDAFLHNIVDEYVGRFHGPFRRRVPLHRALASSHNRRNRSRRHLRCRIPLCPLPRDASESLRRDRIYYCRKGCGSNWYKDRYPPLEGRKTRDPRADRTKSVGYDGFSKRPHEAKKPQEIF